MDDTAETIILEEGNVKITNFSAIIGSKTYAIEDIKSVDLKVVDIAGLLQWYFNGYIPIIPAMTLILILFLGLVLVVLRFFNVDYLRYFYYLCCLWLLLFLLGIMLPNILPATYTVQIETESGTSNILKSKDKDYIQRVVGAIKDLIAPRELHRIFSPRQK